MANGFDSTPRDPAARIPPPPGLARAVPTTNLRLNIAASSPGGTDTRRSDYLLPTLSDRAAIWWAMNARAHLAGIAAGTDRQLLALVQDWVSEPHNPPPRSGGGRGWFAPRTPAAWIAPAVRWQVMVRRSIGRRSRPLPAAHAVSAGILAGLARVALANRFSVLTAFVEMGIQLAEIEAQR